MKTDFRDIPRYKGMVLIGLILFVIVSLFISIGLGAYKVGPMDIIKAIFVEKSGMNHNIIYNIRLPRTFVAGLVGVCLALAGAILQGIMRNSLASPSTIGITSGAGLMSVICLVLFPQYEYLVTPAAFVGAVLTTVLIFILSWKDGINPLRMVLAGLAVSSLLNALVDLILIFFPDRVHNTLGFSIGSLSVKAWNDFNRIWPYALIGFIVAMILSKKLNILLLGDEIAGSLGVNVERLRVILILLTSLLAASAVSVVGLISFVGLIVPHISRILIGSDYKYLLPASALTGAGVLMLCDTIGRVVAEPMEIPVGIILAVVGVPFFLYLLRGGIKSARK